MSDYFRQNAINSTFLNSESWVILSSIEQNIKTKIEAIGTPLKDWDINIYRGILTGYNEAFIIDGKKREELIAEDPRSAEIIRPILRGRDIKRYSYDFANLWLINTHNGIKEKDIKRVEINDYPAIKKYLSQFYLQLEKRTDKGDTPYNLRNCAYMEDFFRPKIIFQEMVQEPSFILDLNGEFMCLDTARIMTGKNIEILISIFNSNLFFYAIKTFYGGGSLGESGVRMKHTFFENFPIPLFSKEIGIKLINLIRNINDDNLKQINKILYQLFELEIEEIEFIEAQ
ncbi:hypothetical protein LJF28_10380 [Chryseobacterium indologenes]|uniref:TaqI-like C-terminal specificity domain-containing protein n=1 Tax=Chryseobacterium indologenes TaxID=253 RepID=UPI001D0CF494|nr:TaqI-like C-terminal specificity domain-containing protein [Chryseobacterium indologenes]UDQ56059.1 hypothetical protein LJF28_10380 [Chryseobacterium indologenes]